ncbi:MAG: response regulator [Deltaproteobacteria bacterium]|nr:response regulator [Deltaproteobacteria bacterium]
MKSERELFGSDCRCNRTADISVKDGGRVNPSRMMRQIAALKAENDRLTQAYAAVVESERECHIFFQSAREAIVVFDHDMRLLKANPASVRLFGYSRLTDMKNLCLDNIFAEPGILDDLLKELLFTENLDGFEAVLCSRNRDKQWPAVIGSGFVHPDENGQPKHFEFVFTDITDHKKLEAQLLQVQKFEAIGTLASGVAHDFNNLLMGIQGRASLMALDLLPSHPHLEHIQAIEAHIQSAKDLTGQLLGFARGGKYQVRPIDINDLVNKSTTLFGRTKKGIRIHMKIEKAPVVVDADRGQMEQVLLNLFVNAWQAMPDGGELFLETGLVAPDDDFRGLYHVKPGSYARVTVTDTGIGMNEATRKRIFDPFFTTKEKSRGTGLGLASAYGIIKNHGGVITVASEPGCGSAFNIYLPVSEKEAVRVVSREAMSNRGSESILLVDDEDMILDVGRAMLETLGYRVVVAAGGEEAVEAVKSTGKEIDLVILDLTMPGMDGRKTFDHIHAIAPTMRVMLSSGHAVWDEQADKIMRKGYSGFIQKPFTIEALSQNVRRMLDGQPVAQ